MIEMVFNGFLALLFVAFMIGGTQIPRLSRPTDIVEAGGFPVVFASVGLFLLIWEMIDQSRKGGEIEKKPELYPSGIMKLAMIVCMTIAYILLIRIVGFTVLTIVYAIISMNLLQSKKQGFNILFAVLSTLVLVIIFGRFFGISLPRGMNVFKTLSFYLY